ncbi:hypothetical protein KJ596_00095 [Patescibacteria group bacterium]|nr:hypothetical protein [Patescibacteria group bacterium]MBU1867852.1 hypothetical protein [Patescibacteria group bacterium]
MLKAHGLRPTLAPAIKPPPETLDIGQEFQDRLQQFNPHIITVGHWEDLSQIATPEATTNSVPEEIVSALTALFDHEPPQPPQLIFWEMENENEWEQLNPLLLVKSVIAVAQTQGGDEDLLTAQLENLLGSPKAAVTSRGRKS